jgi:hypothetical protein
MVVGGLQGQYRTEGDVTRNFTLRHAISMTHSAAAGDPSRLVVNTQLRLRMAQLAHRVRRSRRESYFSPSASDVKQCESEYQKAVEDMTDAFLKGGIYELVQAVIGPFVAVSTQSA